MWFVYLTKSQHATAQSHAAALSSHDSRARKSYDKIAGVSNNDNAYNT